MRRSQRKLRKNRRIIYSDSDESDEGCTNDRNSSTSSEATSKFVKDDNAEQDEGCSTSGSQGSQSQRQGYRTGHYEMTELMEMMNFLIDNDRISSCYSINTWKLMARDKSKRQPESLLKQFKEVLAPNMAQVLETMSKIRMKQLLLEFMEAPEEAQIFEKPFSVSPARIISSSSADRSTVGAASTKLQKSIASKQPKTPMSSASRKSLDGTVISDSEEETETKDTRLMKVPPLFNGSAGQRPVVKESSQTEIKKSAPVTSDIRTPKELGKSADAVSIPSIVPKTEPKEDEDDVVLIEAAAWNDETNLVDVKPLIEPSEESAVKTAILPPVVNRRNDDNNRQMQSVEEESRTELSGEREFSNCLRVKQEKPNSPSVPTNVGESHPTGIKQVALEGNPSVAPRAEIPSRIEREMKNESQVFTSGTPPLQVDSLWSCNDVKQEKPSTSAPTIIDYRTNALDNEELIIKEEFSVAAANVDPRLALIDEKIYRECRVLVEKLDLGEPGPSTTPKRQFSNTVQNEESPARSLKSPAKSSRRSPLIEVKEEPSTSTGIRGHGFHGYEHNHLNRPSDTDADSDSEFSKPKKPTNVSPRVSKMRLSPLRKCQLQLEIIRKYVRATIDTMKKNPRINVENSKKRSRAAAVSNAHDDAYAKCSNPMRTAKKRRQATQNDDAVDSDEVLDSDDNKEIKREEDNKDHSPQDLEEFLNAFYYDTKKRNELNNLKALAKLLHDAVSVREGRICVKSRFVAGEREIYDLDNN